MDKINQLSESLEDYLETILELQTTKTVARSKDIAEKLDIKRGVAFEVFKVKFREYHRSPLRRH